MNAELQTKVQANPAQNFTPVRTGILQRKCALCNKPGLVKNSEQDKEKLTLQRSSADQAGTTTLPRFGHDFSRVSVHSTGLGMIQTKLKINEPGDPYEQEADRVAEQVMRMEEPRVQRKPEEELVRKKPVITPLIQRQTEGEEEEEFLQTKELPGQSPEITPALSSRIQSLKGGVQPLPESVLAYLEPHFSKLRVHTDAKAAELAQIVNIRAYFGRVAVLAPSIVPFADGGLLAEGGRLARVIFRPQESPRRVSPDASTAIRTACDKRCSQLVGGRSYGEAECDTDDDANATGAVKMTVTDTDSCTRPCVEKHEAVHVGHLIPLCSEYHACIKIAGKDDDAFDKCGDIYWMHLSTISSGTECAAYTVEAECMRKQQSQSECASKEAKGRLASRRRGVECYRDCFCTGVATGSAPKP